MCQQISEVNSQMPAQEEAINDDEFKKMYNFEDQELKKQLGRQRCCLVIALLLVGFMAYTLLAQGHTLNDMKSIQHKLAAFGGYNNHKSVIHSPKLQPLPEHQTAIKMAPEHHNSHHQEPEVHVQHHEKKEIIHDTTVVYKSNKKAQHEIKNENDKIKQLKALE